MNEENKNIVNRFLLIRDKLMPERHLFDPKVGKYLLVDHLQDIKKELMTL